ncbi:NAD-dependent epimerase/dehydratase family protein [Paludibaculum fermentans]|uniref:NAD-dependent epimerase/dehydratase family protein n=1 Tax=Paludibaculum fermentans TaxID=1473598 RepID=A0A7S7NWL0_PALFE|nr:NAD-dependent epimerase/dehydratase family protein [Paludibaculum fermentans]QOY91123.1 NAD-dependent epimerase/dehydratase family protein [Paludibaculum fermentans]
MKILITGICGFVGSTLARTLLACVEGFQIIGIDNLMRPGAETNRQSLKSLGIEFVHGDIRSASDLAGLPAADWIIDAAANPSVLAGVAGGGSSRQLFEHNLAGLGNVLEYAKVHRAGLLLLSTSRVYSIPALATLPLKVEGDGFVLDDTRPLPAGVTAEGIDTAFATTAPISLYGATKLASEIMALEYGAAFDFPVWITRCGVLAGAGQFGTPDQGIFAYWINAHLRRRPLRYIGFEGLGRQVRDAFHPSDLAALLLAQMRSTRDGGQRIYTAGGGPRNAWSLARLNSWCDGRFGTHTPAADPRPRPYDIPWVVMSNADVQRDFAWSPALGLDAIAAEIAAHAGQHPQWLELSGL